jgi:hypothetical protein
VPREGVPAAANEPFAAEVLHPRIIISVADSATHAQVDSMEKARAARARAAVAVARP